MSKKKVRSRGERRRTLSKLSGGSRTYIDKVNAIKEQKRRIEEQEGDVLSVIDQFLDELSTEAWNQSNGSRLEKNIANAIIQNVVDDNLRHSLVRLEWKGATKETIDDELAKEIAGRAWLREALAYGLSAIDKAARHAIDELSKDAGHGINLTTLDSREVRVLARSNMAYLLEENDDGARALRKVVADIGAVGWRGATEETIEDVFAGAAADRAVEMLHETDPKKCMLISEIEKLPQPEQDKLFTWHHDRLEREYKSVKKDAGKSWRAERIINDINSIDGRQAAKDYIKDRLEPLPPDDRRDVLQEVSKSYRRFDAKSLADAAKLTSKLDQHLADVGVSEKRDYDRMMMRFGASVWKETYAKGLSEEATREYIEATFASKNSFFRLQARFATSWAVQSFQRISTSHTFAAALMSSDANEDALSTIEPQWRAFMVIVPNNILVCEDADGIRREFTRIVVHTYKDSAEMALVDLTGITGSGNEWIASYSRPTLVELLTQAGNPATQIGRMWIMGARLVAGLLLSLQHRENFKDRYYPYKPGKPGRQSEEPAHRDVIVGRPIKVDCRASVARYIEHGVGNKSGKHAPPTVQVLVRGHYRRQVCGVGRSERKVIWIEPFWRGPDDAPILARTKHVAERSER